MLVYISEVTLCQANGMGAILGIKSATHANSAWPSLGGRQMKDGIWLVKFSLYIKKHSMLAIKDHSNFIKSVSNPNLTFAQTLATWQNG